MKNDAFVDIFLRGFWIFSVESSPLNGFLMVYGVRISSTFSVLRPFPYMATRWHLSIQFIVDHKAKMIFYNIHYKFY